MKRVRHCLRVRHIHAEHNCAPPTGVSAIRIENGLVASFDVDSPCELRFDEVAVLDAHIVEVDVSLHSQARNIAEPLISDHLFDAAREGNLLEDLSQRLSIAASRRSREAHEQAGIGCVEWAEVLENSLIAARN